MKCKALFLLFFLPICAVAQNLVPNGSFEEYEDCPSEPGQVDRIVGWHGALETPDYFNECSPGSDINTISIDSPTNMAGQQVPYSGNAYVGLFTYFVVDDYREYIQCELTEALEIGTTYYFSVHCSRAEGNYSLNSHFNLATNNLGVQFSSQENHWDVNPLATDNSAHINFEQVILDTTNWITLSATFQADQAYTHMAIGNFFNEENTLIVGTDPSAIDNPYGAYVLIDEVCLSGTPICDLSIGAENVLDLVEAITIRLEEVAIVASKPCRLQIYDLTGKLVERQSLLAGSNKVETSFYPSGLYIIHIVFEDQVHSIKFLKR